MKKNIICLCLFFSMLSFILTFIYDSNVFFIFSVLSIPFQFFLLLSLHEIGHLFVCKLTRTKVLSFQIYPFASENHKKKLYYVEFLRKQKSVKFILFGGIIFTFLLEILIIVLFILSPKMYMILLIINTLILFGICFNKNSDLDKIRSEI